MKNWTWWTTRRPTTYRDWDDSIKQGTEFWNPLETLILASSVFAGLLFGGYLGLIAPANGIASRILLVPIVAVLVAVLFLMATVLIIWGCWAFAEMVGRVREIVRQNRSG